MNTACPRRVSLISALGLPTILSPTISATTGDRPVVRRFSSSPIARSTGFASRSKARPSTPTESSSPRLHPRSLCYGLVVLVPLLSTSCCHDAVTVQYPTTLRRRGADSHRSGPAPSQAHERRFPTGLGREAGCKPALRGLRLCRAALYHRFPTCRPDEEGTVCRLEVGATGR